MRGRGRARRLTGLVSVTAGALLTAGILAAPAGAVVLAGSFTNPTPITIPNGAPATTSGPSNPYPSDITVSGINGNVNTVGVHINNYSHTFPADNQFQLHGPQGQVLNIINSRGGGVPISNVNLELRDGFPNLPNIGPLTSGTFGPSGVSNQPFAAPASSFAPGGSFQSQFFGTNPNGVWQLYVFDAVGGDVGQISGGWRLDVYTDDPINVAIQAKSKIKRAPFTANFAPQIPPGVVVRDDEDDKKGKLGPLSFQCSLDGAAFAPCTSPFSSRLSKGRHTLSVQAVNNGVLGPVATHDVKRKKKKKN